MALDNLSDSDIRTKLAELGHPVGPITETTRKILLKKLGLLTQDKNNKLHVRKNAFKFSSGEESDAEQHGGGGGARRISMPPPINFRSRRKTNAKASPLNATVGDFRANNSSDHFSPNSSVGRTRRTRASFSDQRAGSKFDTGSDSDYVEKNKRGNNSSTPLFSPSSASTVPKDSRLFLTNFSKRFNSFGNDVNDIKETDSDDGQTPPRTTYPYRGLSIPVKPLYGRREPKDTRSFFSQLQQYGSKAILYIFLAFFVWLAATYCLKVYLQRPLIAGKPNHVYPVCKDNEIGTAACIPSEDLKFAVALYRPVHQLLLLRSLQSVCGSSETDGLPLRPYLHRRELIQHLVKERPEIASRVENDVDHLSLLLMSNPHWGLMVLRAVPDIADLTAKCNIPEDLKVIPSDLKNDVVFISPCPDLPFSCRAKLYLFTFTYYATILLLVAAVVCGIGYGVWRFWESRKEEEQLVMSLVERILKQVSESCGPAQEYVSIRHVHDMLIRPANRAQMAKLWDRAVLFLEKYESRIRREVQMVHGEDTAVWRWLTTHSNPPSPILPTPNTPQPEPTDNHLYPDLSGLREHEGHRVWQGEAFETSMGSMNSSPACPTPCLKIRHMFQANKNYGQDWETVVKNAIIEKCEGVKIVHIFVDSRSKEGCVYLKCCTAPDAGEAFAHLHGSWFDGLLVTVRFLRLERYHDRFPDSIHCKTPLKPSNNLRLSLAKKV